MQKSEKFLEPFLRKLHYQPTNKPNIKVSDFGLIWRCFCKYLEISNFFLISGPVSFLPLWSPNFMQKIRKILQAVSEKSALPTKQQTKYQSVWFWANFERFLRISPNQYFFQISGSVSCLPLWSPNFMQKIRKIHRAVSEKTALPTHQQTKYQNVWFWPNLETFLRISPNEDSFSNIWLCYFSFFIVP